MNSWFQDQNKAIINVKWVFYQILMPKEGITLLYILIISFLLIIFSSYNIYIHKSRDKTFKYAWSAILNWEYLSLKISLEKEKEDLFWNCIQIL